MDASLSPNWSVAEATAAEVGPRKPRVFISYKRQEIDEGLALEVFRALSEQNEVFIDQTMPVGTVWAERIEAELRRSDYLVVFLSAQSVNSQMVKSEISTAHRLAQESPDRRPAILPIRLAYQEPFQYPLSAYLDPINWAFWKGPEDTPRIIEELLLAIGGGALSITSQSTKVSLVEAGEGPAEPPDLPEPLPDAQPEIGKQRPLPSPNRPADFKSDFYMVRDSDNSAESKLRDGQATLTIKGPDQRGKSSLLFRTLSAAAELGKKVIFLDFQLLDRTTLTDAEHFYRFFSTWICDELDIQDKVEEYFRKGGDLATLATRHMRKHTLKEIGDVGLVLAIDEIESVADANFSLGFYTMLRNWSERRGFPMEPEWQKLDMVFVVSTEPYNLINEPDRSPFNVGDPIILEDFSEQQVATLNLLHRSPLPAPQVRQLCELLGGHPYLVRRALYMLASRDLTPEELFERASDAYGPFGDHLRYHLFELRKKEAMVNELKHVLRYSKSSNDSVSHMLRGAGLITGGERDVRLRCPLYAQFFGRHLNVQQ